MEPHGYEQDNPYSQKPGPRDKGTKTEGGRNPNAKRGPEAALGVSGGTGGNAVALSSHRAD